MASTAMTMTTTTTSSNKPSREGDKRCHDHDEHKILRNYPYLWASVGISHGFLSAIIFGWASLVPVLRDEERKASDSNGKDPWGGTGRNLAESEYTPSQLSQIFAAGVVGNYLLTLPFGMILDSYGPKTTGILASLVYGLGLFLCGIDDSKFYLFWIGFGLVGAARPGIQLPTIHLANLFAYHGSRTKGTGGEALYMSCQAAAFDAGTAIFALFHYCHFGFGWKSSIMFRWYLLVPLYTLVTAIFVWPNEVLQKPVDHTSHEAESSSSSPLSPTSSFSAGDQKHKSNARLLGNKSLQQHSQVNAPFSVVLRKSAFYALATWVGIHIFQLNFVVATINDQLERWHGPKGTERLIQIFGTILPFGFLVLPIVARILHTDPTVALQVVNLIGLLFGAIMALLPGSYWLQILVVFPAVAVSRQMVYSTLFHTIGRVFGYKHYGVIFGLTNMVASLFQLLQTPMVEWSENSVVAGDPSHGNYGPSNFLLWIATFPLFVTAMYCDPTRPESKWVSSMQSCFKKAERNNDSNGGDRVHETTSLLR
ncbi:unnamed protein product [Pseudo-nitzschia multistriata]|uniref:Major facilitator superfamily (MFS) profile domain-containing protein n=1 Tax=Pseudo-nitzschia multistriata TaxID=183589 RepID=A0A448YXK4_9STRA|nr:unnamed protein product [Pseudo-nitzschia multistriata]